jgi:hypothetical protein
MSSYDRDFVLWTSEMAAALREGRWADIDVEHLAEEVEDLGKNQQRELRSRLVVLLAHLLKWQFQPGKRKGGWRATIDLQRDEIEALLNQAPSLRQWAPLADAYRTARKLAADETGLATECFPERCPYTLEEALDPDWLP